ncbi:MAG: hypothetical protein IPK74_12675 [Deltaproteobacteria bacterium]|nr:hypothetical protein [Deltaproteobacteria bacterium]
MGTIADAIAWSGSGATLSMFVVSKKSLLLDLAAPSLSSAMATIRTYALDDDENVLSGRTVVEYDLIYAEAPQDLETILTRCLCAAREAGADVAWFGFEGSFDFRHILSREIAEQIYAVVDCDGVSVASDATLSSLSWAERIDRAGKRARAD